MKKIRQSVAFKSIAGILLLLVVFSVIISIIGYHSFTDALLTQYADGAFLTAKAAAQYVDPDQMDAYAASGGTTEEYQKVWRELDRLCNTSNATFIYVIQPDLSDYAHITFLFSTIDHDLPYQIYDFGYVRDTTNFDYREKYRSLYEQKSDMELVIRDKGYIETDPHITGMIPLKGTDGEVKAILCVQRQMDTLARARHVFLNKIIATLILTALFVFFAQGYFLHISLLHPLKQITEETARFASENVSPGEKLQDRIRNRDEIRQLAASIDQMEEQILSYVENLTKITAEKERHFTELELATRIQAAMLPSTFPAFPDRTEFELYATMEPARGVGGDFYDFFLIDEDHLCLVIADVSGKGVPAALFMMASKIILANNAMTGKTPAKILTDTNRMICSNNEEEMFITVWLGILEISTGKLTAASAGHEYPILKQADGDFEIFKDRHGFVIGGMDGVQYKEYELWLKPGSKLFLYTDGVPEAANAVENMFGSERMLSALNKEPDAGPEQLLKNVRLDVNSFVGNAEQFDDMTMLCIEYKGK